MVYKSLSLMAFKQNDKTIKFIKQVKSLTESGMVKNDATIVAALDWDKTTFSNVKNGRKNVPNDVYKKFTEVYQAELHDLEPIRIKNTDPNKIGSIEERIIRLEGYTTVLFDTAVAALAQLSGKQAPLIRAELQEAITMVLKHSLDELNKHHS